VIRLFLFCRIALPLLPLAFCLLLSFDSGYAAPPTPDKNVTVVTPEQPIPAWKVLWDKARQLVQRRQIEAAIDMYLEVSELKPHIEEVKWELSRNYLELKKYDKALVILESLLEVSPQKIEYLVSAGEAALQMKKTESAARYFGKALALNPEGPLSEAAFIGMVEALRAEGDRTFTIPLMEQLFHRGGRDPAMLLELARFYRDKDDLVKGPFYFRELIGKYPVEDTVLLEAAAAMEQANLGDEAAGLRERYVGENQDDFEIREKLADYYLGSEQATKALPHMLYLLEHDINRDWYLLPVARTYLYDLGRSDRALHYYEQYAAEVPDGIDVSTEISGLQMIIADDLLAIVENAGALELWKDLADVAPDRIGIYRAMAEMLEDMGRTREDQLLEILEVIHVHEPDDIANIEKITGLYLKQGKIEECNNFLETALQQNGEHPELYLLHARCQALAHDDLGRLESYRSYLARNPEDTAIRARALELTGSLGLVDQLNSLYAASKKASNKKITNVDFVYVTELLRNGLARSAEEMLASIDLNKVDHHRRKQIAQSLADVDMRQNRPYKAEQNLRIFTALSEESSDGFLLLAELAIARKDISAAQFWHRVLAEKGSALTPAQKSALFYQKLLVDQALTKIDVYRRAVQYLNARLKTNRVIAEDANILMFAAIHYLQTHRYQECAEMINRFRPKFNGVDKVTAGLLVALQGQVQTKRSWEEFSFANVSLAERIAVGRLLAQLGELESALTVLTDVLDEIPDSTRVQLLLAEIHLSLLAYSEADKIFAELSRRYGNETYPLEQQFRIDNLQGSVNSIFDAFTVVVDGTGRKNAIEARVPVLDYPEIKLMWARALWTEDKWEESLDVYGLLDSEMKREMDRMKQEIETISRERFEPLPAGFIDDGPRFDDARNIGLIMSREFFAENSGSEIANTGSSYYDSYRWGTIINKEMTAKSSLKAKEFYQAEIDYEELFQEAADITEPVYSDLATVYGRLGRYQEETEIIEKIKETNLYYPDLEVVRDKNVRRRQPKISIEGTYLDQEGRGGSINLMEKSGGFGFQFEPTLYQEAGIMLEYSEYGRSESESIADSKTLYGTYQIQLTDFLEGTAKLGVEDFREYGDTYLLYDLLFTATLEKRVDVYGGIKQAPVYDTIESLLDYRYRSDVQLGFSLDYVLGMFFGFDLDFYNYNDDNEGEQYYLWSSYRWFGSRTSLDLTYSYLNLQHRFTNEMSIEETQGIIIPYWSPGDYWRHQISASYRMELSPTGRLQSGTGHFTAKYGMGYEKGDSLLHEIDMNIFLEISPSFLVKGTLLSVLSDDYDKLDGVLSLIYRW